jgi:ubiquinone/menaquinone biosynthesis C-methylase UbiE
MYDSELAQVFFEIHSDNPREGPGSSSATREAFQSMNLPESPLRILDIGCGPGQQTLDLSALSKGKIIGLDYHRNYLEQLAIHEHKRGWADRILLVQGDMTLLPFRRNSLDVIWSEGAIYIMGFQLGLEQWKPFLKSGGYMAVTEISWLKPDPPRELSEFWNAAYTDMGEIQANLDRIDAAGYSLVKHFTLPAEAWWKDYYRPIERKLPQLKHKYQDKPAALEVIAAEEIEQDMFRRYDEFYGYVFYVMQKP